MNKLTYILSYFYDVKNVKQFNIRDFGEENWRAFSNTFS